MFTMSELYCIKDAIKDELKIYTEGQEKDEAITEMESILSKIAKKEKECAGIAKAVECLKKRKPENNLDK